MTKGPTLKVSVPYPIAPTLIIKLFVTALVLINVPVPGFQTLSIVIVVVPNPTTVVPGFKNPDNDIESPVLIPTVVPTPTLAIIVEEPELTEPPKSVVIPKIDVVPNPTIVGKLPEENTTGLLILSTI